MILTSDQIRELISEEIRIRIESGKPLSLSPVQDITQLTKSKLRQIIDEEASHILREKDGDGLVPINTAIRERLIQVGVPDAWVDEVVTVLVDPKDDYKMSTENLPHFDERKDTITQEIETLKTSDGWSEEGAAGEIIDAIADVVIGGAGDQTEQKSLEFGFKKPAEPQQ